MRIAKIALIVVITAAFISFLRGGADFALPRVLPGCDGLPLSPIHFVAGVVLIFLMFWGLRRLNSSRDDADADDTGPYESQYENDSEDDEDEQA